MNRYVVFQDVSRHGANIDVFLRDTTIDSGWPDQHHRLSPPGPQPSQQQPKQPISWAKAPMRTREDSELVAQGKRLEQEVCTRCLRCWDRTTRPDGASHRL